MNKLITALAVLFCSSALNAQPAPPKPPPPPKPPQGPHIDVRIDLDDLDDMIDQQIENALEAIGDDDDIPAHVRESLRKRLDKVRVKVKKRMAKVNPKDMEKLGEELGKMGEEIGAEMEQFGNEMEQWAKQFEKQMSQNKFVFKKTWRTPDVDVDSDFDGVHVETEDDDDLDDAMRDVGKLKLDARQRMELKKLRADSDQRVARAKHELERASETLRKQLENPAVTEQDVSRSIDHVTRLEAEIRKARILAWVNARRLLSDAQRTQVEAAVKGKSK